MELKNIKELMASMEKLGVKRLRLKQENFEIELEREEPFFEGEGFGSSSKPFHSYEAKPLRPADIPTSLHLPIDQDEAPQKELPGVFIKSPMVGTFYSSSGPGEPSFVKVGDRIEKDTIVCIVEAMKVMNEVKAGVSGIVAEVLVDTSHPVEFGTKLFRIT